MICPSESCKASSESISRALRSAISTLSKALLRAEMQKLCALNDMVRHDLERKLFMPGREVVRYHTDTECKDKEVEASRPQPNAVSPIVVSDDQWAPRYAKCENCKAEFDVTKNSKRSCQWHWGSRHLPYELIIVLTLVGAKDVDFDADIWANDDKDIYGDYYSFKTTLIIRKGFTGDAVRSGQMTQNAK
jgi:hypothetical protein